MLKLKPIHRDTMIKTAIELHNQIELYNVTNHSNIEEWEIHELKFNNEKNIESLNKTIQYIQLNKKTFSNILCDYNLTVDEFITKLMPRFTIKLNDKTITSNKHSLNLELYFFNHIVKATTDKSFMFDNKMNGEEYIQYHEDRLNIKFEGVLSVYDDNNLIANFNIDNYKKSIDTK